MQVEFFVLGVEFFLTGQPREGRDVFAVPGGYKVPEGLGFGVWGLGIGVWSLEVRGSSLGFRVWSSGFRI